jgi:hypothetical protein
MANPQHSSCNLQRRRKSAATESWHLQILVAPVVKAADETRLARGEHHQHLAALHARVLLDLGGLGDVALDALEQLHA